MPRNLFSDISHSNLSQISLTPIYQRLFPFSKIHFQQNVPSFSVYSHIFALLSFSYWRVSFSSSQVPHFSWCRVTSYVSFFFIYVSKHLRVIMWKHEPCTDHGFRGHVAHIRVFSKEKEVIWTYPAIFSLFIHLLHTSSKPVGWYYTHPGWVFPLS